MQVAISLSFVAWLFLFLTNAVPFIQWGWIPEMVKKSRYVRPMQISASIYFMLLMLARAFNPAFFESLFPVRIVRWLMRLRIRYLIAAMGTAYALVFIVVGFARHAALETRAFDLGIFAQAVWNTLRGDFLFSSIKNNICLLGDHFEPLVALIAPFYAMWPDPRMLLILQAIAGAACVIPIAIIARDQLKERSWILVFALAFCLFWPAKSVLHEDFHPEVLVEPLLLFAFILFDKKRAGWGLLLLLVAVTAKESIWGIVFAFGLYVFVWKRHRTLGALMMSVSVILFLLTVKFFVPALGDGRYLYSGSYAVLLQNPVGGLLGKLFSYDSLQYVSKLFVPFLLTPLFHFPTLFLTFPVLFQNLLSSNEVMRSTNYHYTAGLTPFLFIASIYGLKTLLSRYPFFQRNRTYVLLVFLAVSILNSGASEYFYLWKSSKHITPHNRMVIEQLRAIEPEYSVLTHNNFIPQLANRKRVYQFEYIASPTKAEQARKLDVDVVIFDPAFWEPGTASVEQTVKELLKSGYSLEYAHDGFNIYRKVKRP
jgi:uncharacterized membrane protein